MRLTFRIGRRTRGPTRQGWTLIELIGALAVSAMVLALMAPVLLGQLERTARTEEIRRLGQISAGLRTEIRRTQVIPTAAALAAWVAPALGWRVDDVLTNARALARAVVFDPNCRVGPTSNRALPYTQTFTGSAEPTNPRLILASSLGEPLPAFLTNGAILTADAFESLWQIDSGSSPPGWAWGGRAEDLLVERINLGDEFVPMTLHNRETNQPRWAVMPLESSGLAPGIFRSWFLRGTVLQLMDGGGTIQTAEAIQAPAAWLFESGKWRRLGAWNSLPSAPSGRDFAEVASVFGQGPANPHGPTNGPQRVLVALTNYLAIYETWAANGFPRPLSPGSAPLRAWEELREAAEILTAGP